MNIPTVFMEPVQALSYINRNITFVVLFLYALIIFVQSLLFCDFVQMDSLLDKIASGRITIFLMCLATKYLCAVRLNDFTSFALKKQKTSPVYLLVLLL